MCFSSEVSLFTFLLGLTSSFFLIKYGNAKYAAENKSFGVLLIFIALIQFMDFLFWIDLNNNLGINKITTILGPILNAGTPTIFYLIKLYFYKPELAFDYFDILVFAANAIYFIYFIRKYSEFLQSGSLTTGVENCHLKWPWLKHFYAYSYIIMLFLNIMYLSDFKYSFATLMFLFLFIRLSDVFFHYHSGEIWCFFGSFLPLILYYSSFRL